MSTRLIFPHWFLFNILAIGGAAQAGAPETVPVGNPDNKADTTGFGAVDYEYHIGKFEVTNEEYCEFLKAVAKKDPHRLYDPRMGGRDDRSGEAWGGIQRSGSNGSYEYTVKTGKAKQPVGYVTFESCARYANWLTNGRGEGDTERGGYAFRFGELTLPDHAALAKEKEVTWVIASENEWYKAAYYDPDESGYWQYPDGSNTPPAANLGTNYPSDVGSNENAASPYGTFDQGGNVWEYNDSKSGNKFGLRGGSFYVNDGTNYTRSNSRYDVLSAKWPNYGFRVVKLGGVESE